MTDASNVVDIKDAPGSLGMILRRSAEIKVRRAEMAQWMKDTTTEMNALYAEDRELEHAEATVRKLLDK